MRAYVVRRQSKTLFDTPIDLYWDFEICRFTAFDVQGFGTQLCFEKERADMIARGTPNCEVLAFNLVPCSQNYENKVKDLFADTINPESLKEELKDENQVCPICHVPRKELYPLTVDTTPQYSHYKCPQCLSEWKVGYRNEMIVQTVKDCWF